LPAENTAAYGAAVVVVVVVAAAAVAQDSSGLADCYHKVHLLQGIAGLHIAAALGEAVVYN
jgi:hypothetical protein